MCRLCDSCHTRTDKNVWLWQDTQAGFDLLRPVYAPLSLSLVSLALGSCELWSVVDYPVSSVRLPGSELRRRRTVSFQSDSRVVISLSLNWTGLMTVIQSVCLYICLSQATMCGWRGYNVKTIQELSVCLSVSLCLLDFRFITLPKPRIYLFKTSFSFSVASLWNTIPNQIKSCNSLTIFKTQLHKWFRSRLL